MASLHALHTLQTRLTAVRLKRIGDIETKEDLTELKGILNDLIEVLKADALVRVS